MLVTVCRWKFVRESGLNPSRLEPMSWLNAHLMQARWKIKLELVGTTWHVVYPPKHPCKLWPRIRLKWQKPVKQIRWSDSKTREKEKRLNQWKVMEGRLNCTLLRSVPDIHSDHSNSSTMVGSTREVGQITSHRDLGLGMTHWGKG